MDFTQVIRERYACKSYDGRACDKAALAEILEAGRLAPTAKNSQEQRIYVVESAEGLAKIDKATPCRYNAGTVIVVAYDKNGVFTYPGGAINSGAEDASIVATQMMLAAANAGVNSCWLNFFDPQALKTDLGLPENEEIVMLLDLGYATEAGKPLANHDSRKPLTDTVAYL